MLDTLSADAEIDIEYAIPVPFDISNRRRILFHPITRLDVYCRDDCPPLHPHRETARGFASRAEAAAAGLRPCGWCRPDAGRPANGPRPPAIRRAWRTLAELFGALVFLP